jgi:hypothetical protein
MLEGYAGELPFDTLQEKPFCFLEDV